MNYLFCVLIILTINLLFSKCDNSYITATLDCLKELNIQNDFEFVNKLVRFSTWTNEEIPCLTRCYVYGRGFFDIEENKWYKQEIVDKAGADAYNYCRYELNRNYENACENAYRGYRCLLQAEANVNKTRAVLQQCANELDVKMEQLQQYIKFDTTEAIPCLFKCFAEKMNLYTEKFNWNFDNWIQAFGPIRHTNNSMFNSCQISAQRRKDLGICVWMYQEYICVERFNYNTEG